MSWGLLGLVLALVPWGSVFVASAIALPCRGRAARALRWLWAAAVPGAVLASTAGLLAGADPVPAVAGLVLAGVFAVSLLRSRAMETLGRMLPAGAVVLAVALWGPAADGGSPADAAVRGWLLPALTVLLAGFAVYLRTAVLVPFRVVMQRTGVFEPELYAAARAIPVNAVRLGAVCLAGLAVWQHDSWSRSALLLAVAVAVDVALVLAVLSCLSRLWRIHSDTPDPPAEARPATTSRAARRPARPGTPLRAAPRSPGSHGPRRTVPARTPRSAASPRGTARARPSAGTPRTRRAAPSARAAASPAPRRPPATRRRRPGPRAPPRGRPHPPGASGPTFPSHGTAAARRRRPRRARDPRQRGPGRLRRATRRSRRGPRRARPRPTASGVHAPPSPGTAARSPRPRTHCPTAPGRAPVRAVPTTWLHLCWATASEKRSRPPGRRMVRADPCPIVRSSAPGVNQHAANPHLASFGRLPDQQRTVPTGLRPDTSRPGMRAGEKASLRSHDILDSDLTFCSSMSAGPRFSSPAHFSDSLGLSRFPSQRGGPPCPTSAVRLGQGSR
jgi:hypothetical protein